MEEAIFIVIYRSGDGPWKPQESGVFVGDRRLAENFAECLNTQFKTIKHVVVEGWIVSPASEAEADKQLGPFK